MGKMNTHNEQNKKTKSPKGEGSKLPSVSTNSEKYFNYKEQMNRLNRARAEGFYLEAIFIIYAMLEDRLSAFLFHAGVSNKTRNKLTGTKTVRSQLDQIFYADDKSNICINKISVKRNLMRDLLLWSDVYTVNDNSKEYLDVLCNQLNRAARKAEVINTLEDIVTWCNTRNELVHALLNKKLDDQEEAIKQLVETGLVLSRKLENFVRSFKVRNRIRKEFNIQ